MPDINGNSGDDTVEVINDVGTLNGNAAGTPIDNISTRPGDDTITVTDSTISGVVQSVGGEDVITISGSTVSEVSAGSGNDTVTIQGSDIADIRLGSGDDTLNFTDTAVSGDIRGNGGTDSLNLPAGTVVTDDNGTFTVTLGETYTLSSGTFELPSGSIVNYTTFENGVGIPCFTRNTLIETTQGRCCIQELRVGDLIPTATHGIQKIRWIGSRRLEVSDLAGNAKLHPVRITAGALGKGLPKRDLLVSRQHRMQVSSVIAERMFGTTDVLIPAIRLIDLPGIFVDTGVASVEYFHLLFDAHEVIFAEGAPTESLYTGPEALRSIAPAARAEIFEIFPELAELNYAPATSILIPERKAQKQLIRRHIKNDKPILERFREIDAVDVSHR